MFVKFSVVLIFATVAFAAEIRENEIVGDKIDDLLKKLEDLVDKGINAARKELSVAEAAVNRTALAIESTTKNSLNGIQQTFQKEIDALKAEAKKAGVNVDDCFGEDEKTLINLPTVTANGMVQCVQGYVNNVFNDANDGLNKIQKTTDDVTEIKQSVRKCGKNAACLAKLAVTIGKECVTLPAQIEKDVKDIIAIVENVKPEITKCGTDAISNVQSQGKVLLTKISKCVESKIKH